MYYATCRLARLRLERLASVILRRFARQMSLTPYHARYFAHELTKRSSSASIDSLMSALADAQVDLNPRAPTCPACPCIVHGRGDLGVDAPKVLPDIIAYLQKETELTRHTLVTILKGSNRIGDFRVNPLNTVFLICRF